MMTPQLHLEPIANKNGFGTLAEYVEVHTYDQGDRMLALITVHGANTDNEDQTVDLWVREDEVRALRDALNQVLGPPEQQGVISAPRTIEEKVAFRKDWDLRFEEGRTRED